MSERPLNPALGFRTAGPLSPLQRMALGVAALEGWRRNVSAVVLGALAALALPPFDLAPVLIVSFSGLVWLEDGSADRRAAFALGWCFGFGFFVAGLYWIAAALLVDAAAFGWLVPFCVLGVPAGLAIFTGLALYVSHEFCQRLVIGGTPRIVVLVIMWSLAEWLRGHVLTGFPWNLIGYAWAGGFPGGLAMLQTTSVVGIYGLSLLTVLIAALPARIGDLPGGRQWAPLTAVALVVLLGAGGVVRLAGDDHSVVPNVTVRLVQPSIPQTLVNDPAADVANFRRLLALSKLPATPKPKIIVWPEAGAPPFIDRDEAVRRAIAAVLTPGQMLFTGTARTDPPPLQPQHVWNSLEVIGSDARVLASYDKAHLVPFGEYVPFRDILPIDKITPGNVDFSAGPGPRTITLPGIPPVGVLICYEAIFPGAVVDPDDRPDWLLNITNDAWYGFSSGPFQHFAIARTRAVEEGLPLVRDGNNGISGVVDSYGRVTNHLDLDAVGVLDASLPTKLPPTLYARFGDWGFAALVLLLAAYCTVRRWPRRGRVES
ncbi:MAG TPA: apolipoprotein N-acyltransferase [Stellaceae bacterium]|nr:apolipoprotein N-acyltransferase [Stellaceae bacterium]